MSFQFSDLFVGCGQASSNIASIADGDEVAVDITVPGAALGDCCMVSVSIDSQNLDLSGNVRAANTVEVTVGNNTGGAIDLGAATYSAIVLRPNTSY